MPSSIILDGVFTEPQFCTDILNLWITNFVSSIVLYMLPLTSVLFFVSWIATVNKTGSTSGALGDSLYLCVTIISRLKCSPRSALTKAFFLEIIEALILFRD